jgi:hypothetical protein
MDTITQITGHGEQRNALSNAQTALKEAVSREYAARKVFPSWSRLVVKSAVRSIRTLELIKREVI